MSASGKQNDVKKKVHHVQSRYKQAAEKVSSQSSLSKERSTFMKSSKDSQGLQLSGSVSQNTSSSSKHSTSEDSRGMTSTPTSAGKLPLPLLDASAVSGADGYLTIPHLKERIGPLSADYVKRNLTKHYKSQVEMHQSCRPVIASRERRKNAVSNEKIAEAEMDILYANYLQAVFLESEAKKALETRSSSTIETLHKLFMLVLQHLYKVKSRKSILKIISSLIEIHEHCQKQEHILKPVFEVIPVLEEQYKNLAVAINSSKHKLHIKDVILPDPGCEGDIIDILQKMNEFISGFFESFPNYKEIISSSETMKSYVDSGELITEALKRGLNLLIEARDLCFSEASLAFGCGKL